MDAFQSNKNMLQILVVQMDLLAIIFFGGKQGGQELFGKSPNIPRLLKFLYILGCFRLKTYVIAPAQNLCLWLQKFRFLSYKVFLSTAINVSEVQNIYNVYVHILYIYILMSNIEDFRMIYPWLQFCVFSTFQSLHDRVVPKICCS